MSLPPPPRPRIIITANIALLLPRVGFHLAGMTASGLAHWISGRSSL
ncbi:MAG TPA: hypothetical protein VGT61_11435 [Thermomicrobiales bacterium]|nr:hypothetical protein [Thermomicrobiales bacterium]